MLGILAELLTFAFHGLFIAITVVAILGLDESKVRIGIAIAALGMAFQTA